MRMNYRWTDRDERGRRPGPWPGQEMTTDIDAAVGMKRRPDKH
jgi:hypothetical protein